ncbi:hypothetical protein [Actinomadura verrucosospora]|nr:hypothetical protein [Actinomadura verrucosospora]
MGTVMMLRGSLNALAELKAMWLTPKAAKAHRHDHVRAPPWLLVPPS